MKMLKLIAIPSILVPIMLQEKTNAIKMSQLREHEDTQLNREHEDAQLAREHDDV